MATRLRQTSRYFNGQAIAAPPFLIEPAETMTYLLAQSMTIAGRGG